MSHKSSVTILSSLFRPENDARPTLLLGAGASFTSGIPLAGESVRRLAKQVFAERELGGRVPVDQIRPSEWMTWLRNHDWFLPGEDNLAENFPLIIEHLLQPEAYRRRLLLELTSIKGDIGTGYHALADLVLRGLAGTVMTTNFDLCLPRALAEKHPHIRHVAEVNRSESDFNEFSLFAKAQIVWLHGKAEQYTDRNLIEETETLDTALLEHLRPLLDATPLVVMGYRGAEDSIMQSLLGDANQKFRQGVYWCTRGSETLHPNVEALKARLGRNFQQLEISGFDEAMRDLNLELAGIQRFAQPITSQEDQEFDDLICEGAVWADVDADLALSTLRRYCEKLERGLVSSAELKPLMREIGLLREDPEGNELPSNGCVLLFGRQPERFFPHSVLTATISDKKRTVFQGNLIKQYNEALNWLETKDVNPEIKVKGKQKHVSRLAYPERALIELLVNMIVHRDYEAREPSTINVEDNYSITLTNPAIMSPRSRVRLATDENGAFDPVPEFSDLRNRSLCDVFFGISAMERAGTGLSDALSLCTDAGGSSLFAFPPGGERFVGKLFRPGASAGSAAVSIDRRPIGTYTLNTLVFSALPQCITKLGIHGGWADLKSKAALTEAGPFVFESRSGLLWTFLDPALASSIFGDVLEGELEEIPLSTADDDPILHKKIAWLMRKHFEGYLRSFEEDGLIIEKTKKGFPAKRAYFKSKGQRNRTIIYDSLLRKGIRRDVVKRRGDEGLPWFECEGFGYEVVRFGEGWGIRIKPFYMFTKKDGQSPLPGYLRTKRATRRIRFDRNTNVESDFAFWGRFLSRGQQTISIGDGHVQDLILEGSFFTADVTEEGLLTDDSSAEDRRPA